ncbi:MAG: hypothetical protein KGI68_12620 [Alphaproteobacteria bacterium]|nr:hypothetical protein [Alphaproteobacteria bacterium]MDE1987125.1 hypothetical protein [Alphaproteobacteria bacterium]MDE2162893.1 hypothetical protein [Alphaproteobacteria bacterium]MDE2267042.1 hypothetical protein [Alphaproteobacteria bacterium]MDE2500331.1 hypothetical protein [Alphaproteobacteria bacterium]
MILSADAYNEVVEREGWAALCDVTANFTHPDLRRFMGLWRRATAQGLPAWDDLPPRLLKPYLLDTALYERVGKDGGRRWRVLKMGSHFAQIMGDLSGKFIDEVVPAERLPRWYGSLDATLNSARPLRFLARADLGGMPFLTGEYLTAPLIGDDGSASLVLSVARFTGGRVWDDVIVEARLALGLGEPA